MAKIKIFKKINDTAEKLVVLDFSDDESAPSPGWTPGGSDTNIQFNDAGAFWGSGDLTWDKTNKIFKAWDATSTANDTVLTVDDTELTQRITLSTNDPWNASASLYVSPYWTQFNNTSSAGDSVAFIASPSSGQLQGTDWISWNVGSVNISGFACSIEYFDVISFEQTKLQATPTAALLSYYDWTAITNWVIANATNVRTGNYDASWNSTLMTINDANRNEAHTGTELIAWPINSINAPTSDPISYSGTFTWVVTTTYTITVAGSGTDFDWTDGTNSGSNIYMDYWVPILLSNGISVTFDWFTYTPTEYWTFTFTATSSQRLTLDYANKTYWVGNTSTSGARARFITDWSTNARVGTYNTNYLAELRATNDQVWFVYDNWTYSSALSASNSQIYQAITNISTWATGQVDVRTNLLQIYLQEAWTAYNDGIFIDNGGEIKIGNFDAGRTGTVITVDDSIEKISVNKPFGLQGYTVATLPTWYIWATAYVTDATTPTFGATVVWGWAVVMKVRYNGTNRIVG